MASVQFDGGKCHGAGEAKAMMRHACADERVRHNHSNKDIDINKTADNTDLYGLTYDQMCAEYDSRMEHFVKVNKEELEAGLTRCHIRKDAVTLFDAIITVPKDLPREREDEWFADVESIINSHYGGQVVLDIKVHRDELHEYFDPDTKQSTMSRTHGHCFMIPTLDGDHLNGKQFSSKKNMQELNREIDAITREVYHARFLTGQKAKDRGFQSVEQLKAASEAARLERQAQQAQDNLDEIRREQARAERARDKAEKKAEAARREASEAARAAQEDRELVAKHDTAVEQYRELTEAYKRVQSQMQAVAIRQQFIPKDKLGYKGIDKACAKGSAVVLYEDGRVYKLGSFLDIANGGRYYEDIMTGKAQAGELRAEPVEEVPTRLLREMRDLAKGQQISKDLQSVLSHSEAQDLARSYSR